MKNRRWSRGTLLFVFFWAFTLMIGIRLFEYLVVFTSQLAIKPLFAQSLPGFKTYRSKKMGIEFNYPERLKVKERDGIIVAKHRVSFKHLDPCAGKGLPQDRYTKEVFDFYTEISILNKTPTEIFREEVMEVSETGLVVGIKNSVRVTYGELDGFRLYNGNHGCGPYSYFFQIADQKVLRVDRWPASEFMEVSENEKQMYGRLRQIILPELEEHFFREILTSLSFSK